MTQHGLLALAGITLLLAGCATTIKMQELTEPERAYIDNVQAFPTSFSVPGDQGDTAWARGIRFINNHSGMRIQTTTEHSVSTYSPVGRGARYYGYQITRVPEAGEVAFEVACTPDTSNFGSREIAQNNARLLAYYMATGELRPRFINARVE